jgi:hypothetical protein
MNQFGGKDSKRHFTVVMKDKEHGLYVGFAPSSVAKKVVTKLCASNKGKKVEFHIREITQGSKKKTYGPYEGHLERLREPIELNGRIIKYKPVVKLSAKKSVQKGGAPKIGNAKYFQEIGSIIKEDVDFGYIYGIKFSISGSSLQFFNNDDQLFGSLQIPDGWQTTKMANSSDSERFLFNTWDATSDVRHSNRKNKDIFGEIGMFIIFNKGVLYGKILIIMKGPKYIKEFSLNEWNKYDFIPVQKNKKENSSMIVHDIGVFPIEGIDEKQGGIFVSFVELGGKIIISLIKMVFDGIKPNIDERWMITLPRMRHWQEVAVDDIGLSSVEYNNTDKTIKIELCIQIKIDDEWFTIFLSYNNKGFVITNHISTSNRILESLPLFAKTNFDASFEPSKKIVGEVYIAEELSNNSSTREYIFGMRKGV